MTAVTQPKIATAGTHRTVKCLVWDLDNTLWDGTLLEGDRVAVRAAAVDVILELDRRGILHSIASRSDHDVACAALKEAGLDEYFLVPQINWDRKSLSVQRIAQALNLGIDALAFIDDDPCERGEVASTLPAVLCLSAADIASILQRPEFMPDVVSDDARLRRQRYREDAARCAAEGAFAGTPEEFLASLGLVCTIRRATPLDLDRALELTQRTHQLNSTGYTYTRAELAQLLASPGFECLTVTLRDIFGDYGTIGLCVSELTQDVLSVRLLLTSCRVLSRGVGSLVLHHLVRRAHARGLRLTAELIPTARNRMMQVAFAFAGFKEVARHGDVRVLTHDFAVMREVPAHVTIVDEESPELAYDIGSG